MADWLLGAGAIYITLSICAGLLGFAFFIFMFVKIWSRFFSDW